MNNYNKLILGISSVCLFLAEREDNKKKQINKEESNYIYTRHLELPMNKIFEAEKNILREPLKNYFHLSIPFNRKIKYIYDLENFYYIDYENYNFNKLSDIFLNIHIFIN